MTDTFTDSSAGYITFPYTVDQTTLVQNALAAIATNLRGWTPLESHIEVELLEQFAAMVAETAAVAAQVPLGIFAYFGQQLVGISPETGSPATALTTWTMVDDAGYTIPAGAQIGFQNVGLNTLAIFTTTENIVVPNGETTATGVQIQAAASGTSYNGYIPQPMIPVTAFSFVLSVTSTTTTSGGSAPETLTQYLNRLSNELQLLAPRPILPADYALMAQDQSVVPGIYRATAFGGLNPYANQFVTHDAEFTGGIGTWEAVSDCTLSNTTGAQGEDVLRITCSGAGNAQAAPQTYPLAENQPFTFCVVMDAASAAGGIELRAVALDAGDNILGTITGNTTTDSTDTTLFTYVTVSGTTPSNTAYLRFYLTVIGPSASDKHDIAYAGFLGTAPTLNLVPNSSFENNAPEWVETNLTLLPFLTGISAWHYTGTGSADGSSSGVTSPAFYLPVEAADNFSAYIDASNVTAGSVEVVLYDPSDTPIATLTQTATVKGYVTQTGVNITTAQPYSISFLINGATATDGLDVIFAEPMFGTMPLTPYVAGLSYSPPNLIYNQERTVTVAVVDVDGNALEAETEAELAAYLAAQREVNFLVYVIPPTHSPVNVTYAVSVTEGSNPTTVHAAVDAALNAYLSPATWGGGAETPPSWDPNDTTVYYLSVAGVIDNVVGVDHIDTLTIGRPGATPGDSNIPLEGFAPLPVVGTITGSAS